MNELIKADISTHSASLVFVNKVGAIIQLSRCLYNCDYPLTILGNNHQRSNS